MSFSVKLKTEWKKLQEQFRDQIWEQEEIVKLRTQFAELEPKTQQSILAGSLGLAASLILGFLLYLGYNAYSLKSKMAEIEDEVHYIQSANEKMDGLRRKIQEQQNADPLTRDIDKNAPLPQFAEQVAKKASVTKDNLEILEKPSSKTESTLELKLNKISLRQLLRVLFVFENAKNGVNITKVESDSKNDPEGYLWAVIGLQKKVTPLASGGSSTPLSDSKKSPFTR